MFDMGKGLSLSQIEKLRGDPRVYEQFCEQFIPCIMGKMKFKVNCYVKKLTDYCSVSDEAMAILIYANNIAQWIYKKTNPPPIKKEFFSLEDEFKFKEEKQAYNKTVPVQKYFDEKKGRGHSYGRDACEYFNITCRKIQDDRQKHGEQFNESFLSYINSTIETEKQMKKKKQKKTNEGHEMIRCFVDDDDSGRGNIPFNALLDNSCN